MANGVSCTETSEGSSQTKLERTVKVVAGGSGRQSTSLSVRLSEWMMDALTHETPDAGPPHELVRQKHRSKMPFCFRDGCAWGDQSPCEQARDSLGFVSVSITCLGSPWVPQDGVHGQSPCRLGHKHRRNERRRCRRDATMAAMENGWKQALVTDRPCSVRVQILATLCGPSSVQPQPNLPYQSGSSYSANKIARNRSVSTSSSNGNSPARSTWGVRLLSTQKSCQTPACCVHIR